MRIVFWGTRGSVAVPGEETIKYGGNTTCIEVRLSDNRLIVIDAGTGIRKLGMELIRKKEKEINIFLTHPHWDHIQGFPFFTPMYMEDSTVIVHGWRTPLRKVQHTIMDQMEGTYFPVDFSQLSANIKFYEIKEYLLPYNSANLSFLRVNHPIICHSIKIEEQGKTFVFMTDNELKSETPITKFTPWEDFVEFCKDADLLAHDAQFTPEELEMRRGWGHSSYTQVLELAHEAKVKKLALFHHDPNHSDTDVDNILKDCHERIKKNDYKFDCVASYEGMQIDL